MVCIFGKGSFEFDAWDLVLVWHKGWGYGVCACSRWHFWVKFAIELMFKVFWDLLTEQEGRCILVSFGFLIAVLVIVSFVLVEIKTIDVLLNPSLEVDRLEELFGVFFEVETWNVLRVVREANQGRSIHFKHPTGRWLVSGCLCCLRGVNAGHLLIYDLSMNANGSCILLL